MSTFSSISYQVIFDRLMLLTHIFTFLSYFFKHKCVKCVRSLLLLSLLILMHDVPFPHMFHGFYLWVHVHWISTYGGYLQYRLNVDSSRGLCSCLPRLLQIKALSLRLLGLWQYHGFRPQIHVKIYILPCFPPSVVSLHRSMISAISMEWISFLLHLFLEDVSIHEFQLHFRFPTGLSPYADFSACFLTPY